ncbi:MAG: hypothetical protein ACREFR_01265 [Limisphaerales bacterium]
MLYTSTNSGAAWTPDNALSATWFSVACSSDGTKVVACCPGAILTSADSGQTWVTNDVPDCTWVAVASSADGNRLVAVAATGQIYTAVPALPSLNCRLSGTNFILSWPAADTGFQLQQSSTLMANSWINSTITNGQVQEIAPATNKQAFYRLISR